MRVMIRLAENRDIEKVLELSQRSHIQHISNTENGFLTFLHSQQDFQRYVDNKNIYLATDEADKQIYGYIIIFSEQQDCQEVLSLKKKLPLISWSKKNPLATEGFFYIEQVAVAASCQRKGVASSLHRYLFELNPGTDWLVAVLEKPNDNVASRMLYDKLGFVRVGTRKAAEQYGLSPFQSAWYFKQT